MSLRRVKWRDYFPECGQGKIIKKKDKTQNTINPSPKGARRQSLESVSHWTAGMASGRG